MQKFRTNGFRNCATEGTSDARTRNLTDQFGSSAHLSSRKRTYSVKTSFPLDPAAERHRSEQRSLGHLRRVLKEFLPVFSIAFECIRSPSVLIFSISYF